jgi:uncharacterized protein (DUF3084 family)
MLTLFSSFITSRIAGPIMGGAAALLAVLLIANMAIGHFTIKGLKRDLKDVRAELAQTQSDLATARSNNDNLQAAIDEQNAAIEVLSAQSDARLAAWLTTKELLKTSQENASRLSEEIRNITLPEPDGTAELLAQRLAIIDAQFLESLQ